MNSNTVSILHLSRALAVVTALTLTLPAVAQDATRDTDMSQMHAHQPAAKQPTNKTKKPEKTTTQPAEMERLHYGQMIGERPASHGLDKGGTHDMSSMQGMDMSSMQGGNAPPGARNPDYSDGLGYGPMKADMAGNHAIGMLLLDKFEYAHSSHASAVVVDGQAWYGTDANRLWLKAEGERSGGKLEDLRTEALWDHPVAAYWSTQLGVRHDFGEGPGRTWAAFGVQGLAPYWFETEATLYIGQAGRTAARFEVEYEALLTQRLILQPKLEINLYGRDDPQRGVGSGLSDAEFGLRLRYEIRREFAPYIGIVRLQRFGHTADFVRAAGGRADETQIVAGVRVWY